MPSTRRDKTGESVVEPSAGTCTLCLDDNPHARYGHLLTLARELTHEGHCDFQAIEVHLWGALRNGTRLDGERIKGYVEDRMYWIRDQVTSYANVADPATGAKLPWWEGRQRRILAMYEASESQRAKAAEAELARRREKYLASMATVGAQEGDEP